MAAKWRRLRRDRNGAVAPTVALSLVALIAVGGIAFDYARLASLDTELQQAADQAALAAASQLDRMDGAQQRATDAISSADNANRLAVNFTRFANDDKASTIDFTIRFCSEFDDGTADSVEACTETDEDKETRFVVVTTVARTANYALTPIVAAVSSGPITASAVAGIEATICNVAPLLVCVPDAAFPREADIGKGLLLKPLDGISGNYGLLDFGKGNNGVVSALLGHGLDGCQSTDDNQTEPGTKNITDAINTRMDVYGGLPATNNAASVCDVMNGTQAPTGSGCPSLNAGKDMVRTETYVIDTAPTVTVQPAAPACGQGGSGFPGELTLATSFALNGAAKGYQRDDCHYGGNCSGGNIGDKVWNFANYMAVNHPGVDVSVVGGTTRYAVYTWERDKDTASNTLAPVTSSSPPPATQIKKIKGKDRKVWTFTKQCNYHRPIFGSTNYPEQKDRRILPVVAANCDDLNGKGQAFEDYTLLRVFDVFLTEPSMDRTIPGPTNDKEIYGEIIGPAEPLGGGSGFQYYSRSKPYLVR